jgi:hypothetical protein
MYEILINVLVFSGILLLLAITIAVVQGILILLDVKRTTREFTKKLQLITNALDIVTMLFSGFAGAKKKIGSKLDPSEPTGAAFIAGLKRALQVLFKK